MCRQGKAYGLPASLTLGWAHKDCMPDGTWYRHVDTNLYWSNYTNCVDMNYYEWNNTVNLIYKTGYLVSLVALLLSIGILLYFKSLRCARTTLHINLFSSFAANNLLWLLWYGLVLADPEVMQENGLGCKILNVVLQYFLVSNYSWMLCEGFYLHTLLVATFISESRLVRWLYVLGWLSPAPFVLIYTLLRSLDDDEQESGVCWINESKHMRTLIVPVALSLGLNVLFMTNIVRVVVSKLMAGPRVGSSRPSSTLLQALRATLLLVPLLGLQYLLTPFKPEQDHEWFRVHEVILAIAASFQGLCVATLFCFCNGEVIAQVRRRWQHLMFRPRANSCTATTVSFVRSANGPLTGEDNV
ncbi:calcitonin gene-related peptide type 1 receptor isoform X2 [Anabrus simplex]|uniref:calcitonin gene-related peptide type 1 receptor isoform X2 n=1 Tax=Anabrus simplex TaxID=316456 RepID=UPI0034DD4DB0